MEIRQPFQSARRRVLGLAVIAALAIGGGGIVGFAPSPVLKQAHGRTSAFGECSSEANQPSAGFGHGSSKLAANCRRLPLSFQPNMGQTDATVKYLSQGRGYSLFLTGNEAVLTLPARVAPSAPRWANGSSKFESRNSPPFLATKFLANLKSVLSPIQNRNPAFRSSKDAAPDLQDREVVRLRLLGADPDANVAGEAELPGKTNYFIGRDRTKWRTDVPTFARVRYRDVYPGVDLVYHGSQTGQLEYDFLVAPGADPNRIALAFGSQIQKTCGHGAGTITDSKFTLDSKGELIVETGGGEIRFHKPVVYQEAKSNGRRELVDGRYVLTATNQIRFALGPYDHRRTLVIDPVINYATYFGGNSATLGSAIAVDSAGNAYVVGSTFSSYFPTQNPLQTSNNSASGLRNAFVMELNPTNGNLVYSTFWGGSNDDQAYGVAVDSFGAAYVVGTTSSSDFPTTSGVFQTSQPGSINAFVTKFGPNGLTLAWSTYVGGNYEDYGQAIAIDSALNTYITGNTSSSNFPTLNAYQASQPGSTNAFVTELNSSGGLAYSTYLGGNYLDYGQGIAVDSSGNVYVTGNTSSSNFPTVNAFQPSQPGTTNAFVSKLNPPSNTLVYSTYLGSPEFDYGNGIAVNSAGNAFVVGATDSYYFPIAGNAVQNYYGGGVADAFVTELNTAGNALVYSTYLGGSAQDEGTAIALDPYGDAFITGWTYSTQYFPIVNAFQPNHGNDNGESDAFVAMLNGTGSALTYSSYLGGNNYDWGYGIAVDSSGNADIAGQTSSSDFPVTSYAYQSADSSGTQEAFLVQVQAAALSSNINLSPSPLPFGNQPVGTTSPIQSITVSNTGTGPLNVTSIVLSGEYSLAATSTSCPYTGGTVVSGGTCTIDIIFDPTTTGTLNGVVTVTDNAGGSPQTVNLTGTGTPDVPIVGISAPNLSFGNQFINTTSAPQTITVSNTGTASLSLTAVAITPGFGYTSGCGSTILMNGSCNITVTFTPTTVGAASGSLTFTDNTNGASGSSQTVTLTGTGTAPVAGVAPSTLPFGNQVVGTPSASQQITLSNTGTDVLTIASITASGDYSQVNNCGTTLTNSSSCTITATFTPTVSGSRNGAVTVTDNSNGVAGSTQSVTMTGTGTAPLAALTPPSVSFGNQTEGTTSATQAVTLANTGSAALSITNIAVSANFGVTSNCGSTLAVSGSCTIYLTFTPSATGALSGTLTVTDNSNEVAGSTQTASLSGTGTLPVAGVSPASLPFGNQTVGTTSAAQTVTLNNTGNAPLAVSSITTTANFGANNSCGGTVAPGGSCPINVTFTPGATGAVSGTLTITDNSNGISGSTQTISLSGTGTVPVAGVSPSSLSFASQGQGTTSAAQTVTLSNTGSAPLAISGITVSANFGETNLCGASVAAGGSCMINVTFAPTTNGALSGSLTVTDNSNGVPGSTQTVTLSGTGTGLPIASLNPSASLSVGATTINSTSASQPVTLSNTGTAALTIASIAVSSGYAQTDTCGTSLNAGTSCTINVTFSPTAPGPLSGTLTVTDNSNGVAGSVQSLNLTGSGADFSVAAQNGSQTVAPGAQAVYTIDVGSVGGAFSNAVALTCVNFPATTTCSFASGSVTPGANGGSTQMTIATTAGSTARVLPPIAAPPPTFPSGLLLASAGMLLAGIWYARRRSIRRLAAACLLFAGLLAMCFMAACGQSGFPTPTVGGTPAGVYTITVTGTSGTIQHSTTVTLTVN